MKFAPIALFVYKRPYHTLKTIQALQKNPGAEKTDLYVFCDAAKNEDDEINVNKVRKIIKSIRGFKSVSIAEEETNKGLANSIINGISHVIEKHSKVIVIEDDIITSPLSLNYFNTCLNYYENNPAVFSISGFNYPDTLFQIPEKYEYDVYSIPRMQCWGWATWKDRWSHADWNMTDFNQFYSSESLTASYEYWIGRNSLNTLKSCVTNNKDVWACRWVYTHFIHHAVCICPVKSYIENIGIDGSGENSGKTNKFDNAINSDQKSDLNLPEAIFIEPEIFQSFMTIADPGWGKKDA